MRSTVRSTRPLAVAALAAGVALPAASASAATLGLDQRCYVAGEQASLSGSGFLPRTPVTVTRDGAQLLSATADNSGAMRGTKIPVPQVPDGLVEAQTEVVASDGSSTAKAMMNVVRLGATFSPREGNFRTLRVSHVVSGFGLAETRPSIYLHYVSPTAQKAKVGETPPRQAATTLQTSTGKSGATVKSTTQPGVKTVRIGLLRGPCGVLRTSPRRLFPFKAETGTWRLQYDTSPKYTRGRSNSSFFWVSTSVKISG